MEENCDGKNFCEWTLLQIWQKKFGEFSKTSCAMPSNGQCSKKHAGCAKLPSAQL